MSEKITRSHRRLPRISLPHHVEAGLVGLRHFFDDRRGASAVEFAMVGSMLIATIIFVMMLGLLLYIGQALDRATAVAARQIMTGAVQKQGLSQSTFISNVLCPSLPAMFVCSKVIVNVQTVSEAAGPNGYYLFANNTQTGLIIPTLSNSSSQFNPGIQASYVYMQVIYPITFLPSFMASMFSAGVTYNGSPAYLTVSTAAFRNEQY
jgi:Flp pilus assembly protein TadG